MTSLGSTLLQPRWLLVALFCGGFALRLPSDSRQLEYDEVIAIMFGQHSFGDIVKATAADTMPPLYYWLQHVWNPGGELFAARFLSTLLSTLTLPAFYALARRLAGTTEALAATALLTVSPIAVFYGHYARMYALLALLGTLSAFWFVRWLQTGRTADLVKFTLVAALSLWVHNLAGLLILTLDLVFLLGLSGWRGDTRRRLGQLAVSHLVMLAAYAPWLWYLPQQLEKVQRAFWIPVPGVAEVLRTVLMWHAHLPLPALLAPPLAFIALVLAAVTGIESVRRWGAAGTMDRQRLLITATLTLAPVGIMFVVSQVRPVYVERAVLVSAGAYYLLLVGTLARMPLRPVAIALTGGLWAALVLGLAYQQSYQGFPRSPFREATAVLASQLQPGDMILHDNKLSFFPMHYFAPALPQAFLADLPGTPNDTLAEGSLEVLNLAPSTLDSAAQNAGAVWYVVFDRALTQAAAAGIPHAYSNWLDDHLTRTTEQQVGDLRLVRYLPKGIRQ